jgi:ribonucleoside-diphosphate reductase alpha chain
MPSRRRLPETRVSITHKFEIGEHTGYISVGLFPDGKPGEVFLKIGKEGTTVRGLLDCVGILTSVSLQYGVPLEKLSEKLTHVRFEPSGQTKNADIPIAKSIVDYVFRWLDSTFCETEKKEQEKHC